MLFNAPIFLFLFLPLTLLGYSLTPKKFKNYFLLGMSLFFYAWGEPVFILTLLISVFINYLFALSIRYYQEKKSANQAKQYLILAIILNLGILASYKYINFGIDTLNAVLGAWHLRLIPSTPIPLPLGISFFTFHAISYLIDVYRGDTPAQRKFSNVALYITFFPQLIAGPIIRYKDIAEQIMERVITLDKFSEGVKRFIVGLAKKVLLADVLASVVDQVFALPPSQLTFSLTWLAIICYTLQIFFDFSGYSDMAIGLAKMFGFDFRENFNYPYISQSIREFWRRWHISLSTWFRDYVYIPLGGNREGPYRTSLNLILVFFLVGLWHGASWTFVVWGLWHGLFLALERTSFNQWLNRISSPFRHLYTLLVILVSWAIFRAPNNLEYAFIFVKNMFLLGQYAGPWGYHVRMYMTNEVILVGLIAGLASTPLPYYFSRKMDTMFGSCGGIRQHLYAMVRVFLYMTILFLSIVSVASHTYKPFIYFRF